MSQPSQAKRMREALELTERNLGSLIAAQVNMGSGAIAMDRLMIDWRDACRAALGHWSVSHECICPRCGVRHGEKSRGKAGF